MKYTIQHYWYLTFLLLTIMSCTGVYAISPQFDLKSENGKVRLTLQAGETIFATAFIDQDKIARYDKSSIVYKDGGEIHVSILNDHFIQMDYQAGNSSSHEIILDKYVPLQFILSSVVNPGKENQLYSFGTAGLQSFTKNPGSYTFIAAVDSQTRHGIVAAWTTAFRGSGIFRTSISEEGLPILIPQLDYGKLTLPANTVGKNTEKMIIGCFDDCRFGLELYADVVARQNNIHLPKNPVGYCTWYSDKFGGACNEKQLPVLANSIKKFFSDYEFHFIQIDDTWQDGIHKNGPARNFTTINPGGPYPGGMAKAAKAIKDTGCVAGIWFMPFAGTASDPWFADKQDYFVRSAIDYPKSGKKNTRIYSQINQKINEPYETFWGGTSLDMTNPKVRLYLTNVVKRIKNDWGIKYFKVDGLWTGLAIEQLYVNNGYLIDDIGQQIFFDKNATNIEAYRLGLKTLREAAGKDVFILGCNLSQNMRILAPSIGYFDAMRIGPDNGSNWKSLLRGPWHGSNRYFYNGRVWWNDPDPVYTRDKIPYAHAQVIASWVALTGQLYAISDWIPDLSDERINLVRKTIPCHQKTSVRPVDLFENDLPKIWLLSDNNSGVRRDIIGLFNWNEKENTSFSCSPEYLGLPKSKKYIGYDFWNDRLVEPFEQLNQTLSPASCRIISVRAIEDHPILLGTSDHITQGIINVKEEKWNQDTQLLHVSIDLKANQSCELRFYIPQTGKIERVTVKAPKSGIMSMDYSFKN